MMKSQNGWSASYNYEPTFPIVPLRWITGKVRGGDVRTVFDHLGARFNAEVEPINPAQSWGFAPRQVRGDTSVSNHASGTAVDFNAPKHPLGKSGTFTAAQVRAIHRILADLDGAIRWGGDYDGRKDEMHFEVNVPPERLARVAAKLTAKPLPKPPAPKPAPAPTPKPKETPEMFVAQYGASRFRLITGGKIVGISEQLYNQLAKQGVPAVKLSTEDFDGLSKVLGG